MRVSFEWLREFVPVDMTPEAVADRLTMAGLEVEDAEEWGTAFERIVVGRIADITVHPSTGRLLVCRVEVGSRSSPSSAGRIISPLGCRPGGAGRVSATHRPAYRGGGSGRRAV